MKIFKNIGLTIITIVLMSCNSKQKQQKVAMQDETQQKIVELISVADLQKINESMQLVDVRTPEEYKEGYIKNAVNIDFYEDNFIEKMSELNKEEPIYIYCRSGGRSNSASKKLKAAGFTKVYDLDGGFINWKSKEKEISKNK